MSANATPQSPAIQTRDLTRKYGRVTAINSLDITIEMGEKVVLVGPNGSGKTTLIKLLSTLIKPTSGDLFIQGYDVAKHDAAIRSTIGVVLHEPLLYGRLTAAENLRFYAKMFHVPDAEQRIDALADQLDLTDLLKTGSTCYPTANASASPCSGLSSTIREFSSWMSLTQASTAPPSNASLTSATANRAPSLCRHTISITASG